MAQVEVKTDVTGSVWKIEVVPGQSVAEGDTLVVIESMKMEIPVLAEAAGVVGMICVQEGDAVREGQSVVVIEA